MTAIDPTIGASKPITLRVIFILNALKILLAFGFFAAFKFYGLQVGELVGPQVANLMLYTMLGYMVAFACIVASILKRGMIGIRTAIGVDFLVSIPATAVIGFIIATISMGLTLTASVRAYFAYSG
ncbi:hypothetical protein K3740_02915 [Ruegeria conchae]|uniref:hypothetical protein n=1 Tax=Ruegeria conchae TaxID=981384 RepID=UPI0021A28D31|nr:hypothetical protein [Ruegeria conchae]UWR03670.1 hypothetical protein K3740_02915 [Ruegeria conchae]